MLEEREDADEFLEEEREEQADGLLESRLGIDDLEEHDPEEHSFFFFITGGGWFRRIVIMRFHRSP